MTEKSLAGSRATPPLDEVSKSIIEQLQQDGRRSYAAIGKAVGLSEAAVRQRVQRLSEGGIMQIVAVTDPLQLGFDRQAMVGIRVDGDIQPVAEALPTTHVFEAARGVLAGDGLSWTEVGIATAETVVLVAGAVAFLVAMLAVFRKRGYISRHV